MVDVTTILHPCGRSVTSARTAPGRCARPCDHRECPAAQSCQSGTCKCPSGTSLCNGACIDTQTDTSNCGGCGNTCAVGQGCSAGACTCGTASVSLSGAVQPIFTSSCASAGCHSGPNPAQGLSLVSGKSYAALVNVLTSECSDGRKRVLPGQPSQSYLIEKLMGTNLCFGTPMPKSGSIPSAQIQTIANWICEGAPNN